MNKPKGLDDMLDYDEYRAYIQSETWNELRNKRLMIDGFQCALCGNRTNIQVHHLVYPIHKNFGTEPVSDLITLCAECHMSIDKLRKGQEIRKSKVYSNTVKMVAWVRVKNKQEATELKLKYSKPCNYATIDLHIFAKDDKAITYCKIDYLRLRELREEYGNNVAINVTNIF